MKKNSPGYSSIMFFGVECARISQDIADLFARYFQGVYVNFVAVENADGYVFDEGSYDPSVLSLIQFTEGYVEDALLNLDEKKDPVQTEFLRRFL
jgi:hypothetical protein